MSVRSNKYSIQISIGEPYFEDDRKIKKCWKDAEALFQRYQCTYFADEIVIETEWSHIPHEKAIITLTISGVSDRRMYSHIILRFAEMMFITMNLAVPGSLNFYRVKIINNEEESEDYLDQINLSSFLFDLSFENSNEYKWPTVQCIPLKKVLQWYQSLEIGFKQVAETNTERCIFSLINFSQNGYFSPAAFLWLTHALEAIYDTPKEGILSNLKKRIFLFLGEPLSNQKDINKRINALYDLRSQFVHGTMEIVRFPAYVDWDAQVEKHDNNLMYSGDYGALILFATLQKMILKNARVLSFSEAYRTN